MKRAAALILAGALAGPAAARESLGIYHGWGAFRDMTPYRCYAIAQPPQRGDRRWQPFASVSTWPAQRIRGQIHVRLSRERRGDAPVTLKVDDQAFPMVAGPVNAWAPNARVDAAIVAAMRSGQRLTVTSATPGGAPFTDRYQLKGAASAIDAAALGCARRG
jgi:hypothetical protein